jgi:hypothetical protein
VSTDSLRPPPPGRAPSASACEPYREIIADAFACGRNAVAIWQDLVGVAVERAERTKVQTDLRTEEATE